ncbi:MAG: class I SAM-dependent methyltransferase [Bdellovibrionales bacterium]|nr:class I SAM-dependent methyltransferase [Bdellovibrionales bacterium]
MNTSSRREDAGPAAGYRGDAAVFPLLVEAAGVSLHYGYFSADSAPPSTLEDLRKGQDEFTRKVVEWVPSETSTVLDVGTGTGDVARALAARGHRILTISPDPNQGRWLARLPDERITFEHTRFEDLGEGRTFDCVLFSESANYVALENLFSMSAERLNPGGSLIVAAPLLVRDSSRFRDMHRLSDFREAASRQGWRIQRETDFTAETAPTLAIGGTLYDRFAVSLPVTLADSLRRKGKGLRPRLAAAVLGATARLAARLRDGKTLSRLDAEAFREEARFVFFELRRN